MNKETKTLVKLIDEVSDALKTLNGFPISNVPILNAGDAVYYNVDCGTHDSIYGGTKSLDGGTL